VRNRRRFFESPINGAFGINHSSVPRRKRLGYVKATEYLGPVDRFTALLNPDLRRLDSLRYKIGNCESQTLASVKKWGRKGAP
jgi:hypothetical protein